MMMLRNPLHPAADPALHRSADKPGDATGEDDRGNLGEIDQDENIAEQIVSQPFEMRQYDPHNQGCVG